MADTTPASWRTIRYGSPVLAVDGSTMGTVAEVLGSDSEDIFHGIRLRVRGSQIERVLPAADVTGVGEDAVTTQITPDEVVALEPYDDVATFHLASVGWLRRTLGWRRDAETDEGPGSP